MAVRVPPGGHRRPAGGPAAWIGEAWGVVRHRRLSAGAYRWIAGLAVWALALIIVTGALVRLTGSGLGCTNWPTCDGHQVVAPWQFHAWVEFGNRLITALLSVAVVLAVGGALVRVRRRRDLTWLSFGLVAGVAAEIVLGGLTVKHKLAPQFVTAHFLLAVLFMADAVVLHHRSRLPEEAVPGRPGRARTTGPAVPLVTGPTRVLGWLLVPAAAVVVGLGTVVTSTGPHGGDPAAPRYHFSLHQVAQLHGSSAEAFVALTILTLWSLSRTSAPRHVVRRAQTLLGVVLAQGAIGYTQYFSGDPAAVVALHETGAVVVIFVTLRFALGMTARPEPAVLPGADGVRRPALAEAAPSPGAVAETAATAG